MISQVLFTSEQPNKNKMACRYIITNKVTLWAASYSACVVYTKTIIHLSVGESGGYFTSTLVTVIIYWWNICNDLFTARLHVGSVSLYKIVEHCNKYKINSAKLHVNNTILFHNFAIPKLRVLLHQHHELALLLG